MNRPHVLVDARFSEHRRGGDRCRLELARGLLQRDRVQCTFLVYPSGREVLHAINPEVQTVVTTYRPDQHPQADYFEHISLPNICRRLKVDVYHGTFQVMPLRRAAPVTIATIHDLALFAFPHAYSRKFGPYMRGLLRFSIAQSDFLISVSEATRSEIERTFPSASSKITTILNGVGSEFSVQQTTRKVTEVLKRLQLPGEYVLFVGNLEKKKNLPRLIQAFLMARANDTIGESLVVVGSKPDKLPADEMASVFGSIGEQWQKEAEAMGVIFTGYVSEDDLPIIYRGARAVAYPSLYEGFGMPVLEGLASGVPVLTSDISSLPEVADGAAWLVDPTNIESIAAGLKQVLNDEAWRTNAISAGLARAAELSWDNHVDEVEQLYLSAVQSSSLSRYSISEIAD